jgi:glutaredoxin 3
VTTSGDAERSRDVTIYTTPTCHWCRVAKDYFAKHKIAFREVDVTKDRRGLREMVLMTGGRAVPVVRVGSHAMTGWNAAEFEKLRTGKFKRR